AAHGPEHAATNRREGRGIPAGPGPRHAAAEEGERDPRPGPACGLRVALPLGVVDVVSGWVSSDPDHAALPGGERRGRMAADHGPATAARLAPPARRAPRHLRRGAGEA